MSRGGSVLLLAAALCVFLLSWSLLHHGFLNRNQIVDTPTYAKYGDAIARGAVPYRDFRPEYPPAALPMFVLPALGNEHDTNAYDRWFDREMALCGCFALLGTFLCLRALNAGTGRTALSLLVFALSPLLIGSVVLSRFDWWPAALAVVALAALLWERPLLSGVLLGVAAAAKLWPAALAPLFLIWLLRVHGGMTARRWAAVFAATVAAIFLPFTVISPRGIGHSFYAQLGRPLQLESLGAAILLAVHHWAGTPLQLVNSFGSQNVTGPGTHVAAAVTTVLGIAALLFVWLQFARGALVGERLVTSCAASVAALLAFGKVFSPQFVIWLVPFVLLVGGLDGFGTGVLLTAILLLTQSWFPRHYWNLAQQFAPTQSGELLARDLCVVGLFFVLAWPDLQHQVLGEHRTRLEALKRVRTEVD